MKPVMTQNKFLQKLPETILEKFDQHAELVQIVRGRGDNERESRVDFIYFPVTCVYSLEMPMADGCTSHLGLLGYRDAIGARNLIDLNLPGVPRVILSGYAIRLRSEIFAGALSRSSDVRCVVQDQFVRMSHSLGVTNACNLRHPLQRRLARWVLNLNYASGLTGFDLTHEELAHFLGVRREAVTEGLARLTQAGVLKKLERSTGNSRHLRIEELFLRVRAGGSDEPRVCSGRSTERRRAQFTSGRRLRWVRLHRARH